jgi:hypothetical protein
VACTGRCPAAARAGPSSRTSSQMFNQNLPHGGSNNMLGQSTESSKSSILVCSSPSSYSLSPQCGGGPGVNQQKLRLPDTAAGQQPGGVPGSLRPLQSGHYQYKGAHDRSCSSAQSPPRARGTMQLESKRFNRAAQPQPPPPPRRPRCYCPPRPLLLPACTYCYASRTHASAPQITHPASHPPVSDSCSHTTE